MQITEEGEEEEGAWVGKNGGLLVHIARPDAPKQSGDHSTERRLTYQQGDYDLLNDGSVDQLMHRAAQIARVWCGASQERTA